MESAGCRLVGRGIMSRGSFLAGTPDNSPFFITETKNEWN